MKMEKARNLHYSKVYLCALFIVLYASTLIDEPNILVGTFRLKIAYATFPILALLLAPINPRLPKAAIVYSLVFLSALMPSMAFTHNRAGSIAFLVGAIITIGITLYFSYLSSQLGTERVTKLFIYFYRFSIIVAALLFITGIHERARFTLYEPSYFAIALIPYISITLIRIYSKRDFPAVDTAMVLTALITTSSASLFIWILLCLALVWWRKSQAKLKTGLISFGIALLSLSLLVNFNDRAKAAYNIVANGGEALALAINVGGNRLQRILVTLDVTQKFPLVGVGMNAMTSYAAQYLDNSDYELDGMSASDFDLNEVSKAVNTYLDIASETGLIGLCGYLCFLLYIYRRKGHSLEFEAFHIAFVATSIALMAESSYLRAYVWSLYGVIVGLSSYENSRFTDTPAKDSVPLGT